ncbi:N-acetylglucosaminyl-diphospho-decaprenol L-rhamnosyltransferase [Arthrobacter sp. Hiyo4]|nr:N-acetylglucosaminyl-diphospho-decaprenol L-rhamnosyltransferase [Arthrobacter sp. Hiyo4]
MGVDVIIVSYNSSRYLPRLASSLQKSDAVGSVVVVDNASTDNSIDVARKLDWGGRLQLIQNHHNVGFGAAMNQGVGFLEDVNEFVLLVNPDVQLESQTVSAMLSALTSDKSLACVGPRLETTDGRAVSSARALPTRWNMATRRVVEQAPVDEPILHVGWVCGAAMLWRRQAFEQVGGFSPEYFLYYEDVDICRKAWRAGMKVATVANAKAIHDQGHGKEPSTVLQNFSRSSRRLYAKKWLGSWGLAAALVAEFLERLAGLKNAMKGQMP